MKDFYFRQGGFENTKRFIMLLEETGYGESMLTTAKNTLKLLLLFIDMHNLGYRWPIVELWYRATGDALFGKVHGEAGPGTV